MKTRESGMPSEDVWQGFFEPAAILRLLRLSADCGDVVEFGCGYGTFTIPAAQVAKGTVYALDIDPAMIDHTAQAAKSEGLSNVVVQRCDFLLDPLPVVGTADYAMLFNILHAEHPEHLIERAKSTLRAGGLLGIMHWNYDPTTPRGPSMEIRPKPEQLQRWGEECGFEMVGRIIDLPPYHYGFAMRRK